MMEGDGSQALEILRRKALNWLGKQEYNLAKFRRKLQQQQASEEQIASLIDEFCQANWLSESRYSQGFVRARVNKGQGRLKIIHDGHSVHQIELSALEEALDQQQVDWLALAVQTYQKRYGTEPITDFKQQAKRMRYMQYQGFTLEQIKHAIAVTVNGKEN